MNKLSFHLKSVFTGCFILFFSVESPLEEFPLQEISCQTPQNVQEKQAAKDGDHNEGLKNSPLRGIQEQKNEEEKENKLSVVSSILYFLLTILRIYRKQGFLKLKLFFFSRFKRRKNERNHSRTLQRQNLSSLMKNGVLYI